MSLPDSCSAETKAAGAGSINRRAISGRETFAMTWFLRMIAPAGSVDRPDNA
ncbi:Uncharacterised protein [Mycobacterium tuberculosis]|nr:Uncharacterised protein [Mycobacterium tuberculosis]